MQKEQFQKVQDDINKRLFILDELKNKYTMIVNFDYSILVESSLDELKQIWESCKLHVKMNQAAIKIQYQYKVYRQYRM